MEYEEESTNEIETFETWVWRNIQRRECADRLSSEYVLKENMTFEFKFKR